MSNDLSYLNKEVWADDMQEIREKSLLALKLANYRLDSQVKDGDVANRPYRSNFFAVTYTKGTDLTRQDASSTNEYLSIDIIKAVPIYLDDVDAIQNSYPTRQKFAQDMQVDLNRGIDAKLLSEYDNATYDVDGDDVTGGTTGTAITVSTSNVDEIFTAAGKYLNLKNIKQDNRFAVIGPTFLQKMQDYISGKDTVFGDKVGMDGFVGRRFGFDIYVSNNLTFTARWTPANQPSNADYIVINGVTITFTTSTPAAGGEVYSETSVEVTLNNLVALLNNSASTAINTVASTSKYFYFTQAQAVLMEGIVATDGATYLGIELVGGGEVAVTASETNDPWTLKTLHCLFGRVGAIDLVLQKAPGLKIVPDADRLGDNLTAWTLYGVKTFADGADAIVDVNQASTW